MKQLIIILTQCLECLKKFQKIELDLLSNVISLLVLFILPSEFYVNISSTDMHYNSIDQI